MRNQRLIVPAPPKRNSQVLFLSRNKTGQTTFGALQPPEESVKPAKVLRSNSRALCRKTRGNLMVIGRPTQGNPPTRVEISVHIFWIVSENRLYNSPPGPPESSPSSLIWTIHDVPASEPAGSAPPNSSTRLASGSVQSERADSAVITRPWARPGRPCWEAAGGRRDQEEEEEEEGWGCWGCWCPPSSLSTALTRWSPPSPGPPAQLLRKQDDLNPGGTSWRATCLDVSAENKWGDAFSDGRVKSILILNQRVLEARNFTINNV